MKESNCSIKHKFCIKSHIIPIINSNCEVSLLNYKKRRKLVAFFLLHFLFLYLHFKYKRITFMIPKSRKI